MTTKTPGALDSQETEISLLIKGSEHCVDQCEAVLNVVSEQAYAQQSHKSASIGTHMRHVLDRFQCLFNGLPHETVDYDARRRDKSIETNRAAARFAAATVKRMLSDLEQREQQGGELGLNLLVRESVHHDSPQVSVSSSLQRELMGLITHATHHLALMVMIGQQLGFEFDKDLGKAPSTLIHERG